MAIRTTNTTAIYLIAFVVIIVAFLLLGGGTWLRGMVHMHGARSNVMAGWNWAQILIGLAIGFLLGLLVARRKW
jgi:hypothetical protein